MLVFVGIICTISLTLLSAKIMFYMLCDVYIQVNKSNKKAYKTRKKEEEIERKKIAY